MACFKFCLSTYQSALWAKKCISLCEPYAPYLYKEERKCLTGVNTQANKMIWNARHYTSHTANDEQKFAFGIHANLRLSTKNRNHSFPAKACFPLPLCPFVCTGPQKGSILPPICCAPLMSIRHPDQNTEENAAIIT